MSQETDVIDRYGEEVPGQLPPAAGGRRRIERALRVHLQEAEEASGSEEEAVREMGPAEETAAGYAGGPDLEPASPADRTGAFPADAGLGVVVSAFVFAADPDLVDRRPAPALAARGRRREPIALRPAALIRPR